PVEPHHTQVAGLEAANREIATLEPQLPGLDYGADGVVVKVNPLRLHAELGTVGDREPRWAVARKFAPEVRVTKLLEIKINVGRTGSLDRKSTRLNSSHEWISYAVFCLKKKTTKTNKRTHV